jgi:hypothetical protein
MQTTTHSPTDHSDKETGEPSQRVQLTTEQFTRLEQEINKNWITAPVLPPDIDKVSVFESAEQQIRTSPHIVIRRRQNEFRSLLQKNVRLLLGEDVAASVAKQLETNHSIATAQHSTPLAPNTLNCTLFNALAYFGRAEADRQNIIVLGCAGVSISNPWYARGHIFHALINDEFIENQLNFFGRAMDSVPVISAPALTKETQKAMTKAVLNDRSHQLVKKREFNKLLQFLEDIAFTKSVLEKRTYIDQLTVMNFHHWKKIFSYYEGNVPNLVFLSQEKIAIELILEHHLGKKTLIHEFIFNKEWHELLYKYFNNIICAFSVEKQYGTFLFWAISKETKSRTQLFMKDGVLSSLDGSYTLEVTPENIRNALIHGEILPSVMLTFVILSLYYGYYLVGGPLQPAYLTAIKNAYVNMMQDLNISEEQQIAKQIITNDATLPRPAMVFLDGPNDQRIPASGLDLYLYGGADSWTKLMEAMKNVTFKEAYYRIYPTIYKNLCKNPDKFEDLLSITERDIEKLKGLDKKIPAWAVLSEKPRLLSR